VAGDWIKLEHATLDKPEVLELAELLSMSHGDALLLCLRFWVWADQQSRDGRLSGRSSCRSECRSNGVSKHALDALMRCPGFSTAMIHVGWLDEKDDVLIIVNFDRHNGENSKKRALKSRAQAEWRRNVDARVGGAVDAPVDQTRSTTASTREEKRRDKTYSAKTSLPDDWSPSELTIATVSRNFGLRVPEDIDRYVAAFRDACQANGYRYKDFDAAFRNCVRQDWPKLRAAGQTGPKRVAL
jgi:hypothetical protein